MKKIIILVLVVLVLSVGAVIGWRGRVAALQDDLCLHMKMRLSTKLTKCLKDARGDGGVSDEEVEHMMFFVKGIDDLAVDQLELRSRGDREYIAKVVFKIGEYELPPEIGTRYIFVKKDLLKGWQIGQKSVALDFFSLPE